MKNIKILVVSSYILLISFNGFAQNTNINQLKKDVTFLASDSLEGRETGTIGEIIASDYIAKRMKEMGLKPKGVNETFFQEFKRKTKAHPHDTVGLGKQIIGRNVIGFWDNKAAKTIVIGAHYDHLGYGAEGSLSTDSNQIHNGADDNASGVGALLNLAKKLQKVTLNSNILFIAFSGEEKGLWGSNFFAKNMTIDKENIRYMINMDMVGRLDSAKRLAIYGVGTSPVFIPILDLLNSKYEVKVKYDSSGIGPSDHTSFYLEDIPVLHFFTGQHADYHKPTDDVEFINFEGIQLVSNYIQDAIIQLNNEKEILFLKTKSDNNKARRFKVTLGVIPDYLYDGKGMKLDGIKQNRPAENGGLKRGDVIIKMGEFEIKTMIDYMNSLGVFDKGQTIQVVVLRDKKEVKATITF